MRRLIPLGRALVLGMLLALLTVGPPAAQAASPGVLITEVLAANTRTAFDDQGRYSDWIELHNPTDTLRLPHRLHPHRRSLPSRPSGPCRVATLAPGAFWWCGRPA